MDSRSGGPKLSSNRSPHPLMSRGPVNDTRVTLGSGLHHAVQLTDTRELGSL